MRNSFVKLLCAVSLCMMVSCMEKEDTPPHFVHVESVAFNVKDGKLTLPETHTYGRIHARYYDTGQQEYSCRGFGPEIRGMRTAYTCTRLSCSQYRISYHKWFHLVDFNIRLSEQWRMQ